MLPTRPAGGSLGTGAERLPVPVSTAPKDWQGWLDSNQRMRESKSRALPLGYTPVSGEKKKRTGADAPALFLLWGGRWDSNPRPSEPQSDALTN